MVLEAAKAHDIGEHDSSQPAGLGLPGTAGVLWQRGDYPAPA